MSRRHVPLFSMLRPTATKECVRAERVDLPRETMEWLAEVDFDPRDRARFTALSEKERDGTLTKDEHEEIEDFGAVDQFLEKVRGTARKTLS